MTTNEMEASIKGILKESRKREDLFIKTLFALKYNDTETAKQTLSAIIASYNTTCESTIISAINSIIIQISKNERV